MTYEVIIIGAGAAGLSAAQALQAAGREVLVVEARNRVGGRIWTEHSQGPVEYGAEFIHGEYALTWEIVRANRLAATAWANDGRRFAIGSQLLPADDPLLERVYGLWEALHTYDGPDESVLVVLDHLIAPDDPARYFVLRWLANIEAGDAARISAKELSRERAQSTNGDTNFHLDAGYAQVPAALATDLNIRLATPVLRVAYDATGVTLNLASGETLWANTALITVPLGVLQAGSLAFDPPLPAEKRAAIGAIDMGHVTKLALWFADAFWDPFVILSTNGPVASWWPVESARVPTLMGYTGGPAALNLARLGEQSAIAAALDSLCEIFGPRPRELLRGGRLVDWSIDPWSRGAYSYSPFGMGAARSVLAAPMPPLFFAGEATCTGGDLATVHGAIGSGRRAAGEILKKYQ